MSDKEKEYFEQQPPWYMETERGVLHVDDEVFQRGAKKNQYPSRITGFSLVNQDIITNGGIFKISEIARIYCPKGPGHPTGQDLKVEAF